MAAEDAGGSGDLAILVNTEMIVLKGAVKAAASAGSVTGKVVNKALLSPFRLIQFCMKLHKQHIISTSDFKSFTQFMKACDGDYIIANLPTRDPEQLDKLMDSMTEVGITYCLLPDLDIQDSCQQIAIRGKDVAKWQALYESYVTNQLDLGGPLDFEELKALTSGNYKIKSLALGDASEDNEQLEQFLDILDERGVNYSVLPDLKYGDNHIQIAVANQSLQQFAAAIKSNIQPITDQLCEKYGLKKLTYVPGKRKGVDYGTWREKKDPSGSQRLREAIDMAIAQSDSYDDFLSIMRKSYQVKIGFSQKWNSEYLSFKDFKTPAGRYRRNYVLGKSYTVASIQKRISLNKMEIPESLKRLPPHIRGFESSIGSGFRSANGLYLTQHQKRYMIPYWRLKNSERTVTSGTGNIREYSKEADRNLRDLQTVQDNKIRTVQDLSSRLDELNQMTDSIRRELRAIQSSREDSETENVISEYLSIQSAFANAAVPIEMEGKFENRLDEIEENYPIEELIHQKESNSKKEKQLQKEIKNLQQASRRLSKLKKIQKR